VIWSVVQVLGRQGITLLIYLFLAFLLNPSDFGILGMAMTWIAFIQTFSEMGFGAALIQKQDLTPDYYSTVFYINVSLGLLLTALGILLSWPCAIFFKTPAVQPIMAVLSISIVVNAFSLTHSIIAQKELRFRELAVRDIVSSVVGGVVGVTFALLKFGVWSLVFQVLSTSFISSIFLWHISPWRPVFKEFSTQHVKDIWPFSSKIFTFNIFAYFAKNVDKLIIGYYLGNRALGLYTFAYKVVIYSTSTFVGAIGNYLFPKFSKIQADLESIKSSYHFVNKTTNLIVTPIMLALALLAPGLIVSIFGEKWSEAIPLIQIFTAFAIMIPWISHVGQVMKALNHAGWLMMWSVFVTVLTTIFIIVGTPYGIVGAVVGLVATYVIALPVNFWILNKLIRYGIKDIVNSIAPSLLSAIVMGLILKLLLMNGDILGVLKMPIIVVCMVASYFIVMRQIDRQYLQLLMRRISSNTQL
jgi:teichuronic acid exporter